MQPQAPLREPERANYDFFLGAARARRGPSWRALDHKSSQFLEPLFEYSGACAGCGETPYLKLLTQLFGDRLLIANATGCSSIYGGNLPTTPYTTNRDGRGPAWSNSLFEDNAEFGLGFRLGARRARDRGARAGASGWRRGSATVSPPRCSPPTRPSEAGIAAQRERVVALRRAAGAASRRAGGAPARDAGRLPGEEERLAGRRRRLGLRHRLRRSRPRAGQPARRQHPGARHRGLLEHRRPAVEGDAARRRRPSSRPRGKATGKKDLGLLARMYGHVYVARVAFGAKMTQTVQAFLEAEAYAGPSLIIAYSHCIAHGYDMAHGAAQQKLAVDSGVWPLYRFDPRRVAAGEPPLHLDYGPPQGQGRRLHAQRVALPHGRAHRPGALQALRRRVAGRGRAPLRRSTSSSRESRFLP